MPKDLFEFTSELDVAVGPSGLAPDLLAEILAMRTSLIAKLTEGKCKNFESYADAVGCLRALQFVLAYPERKRLALEKELGTPIDDEE
jgi:hypothetical protein